MIRPISISLSPNTETDDILAAFALLFQPWRWKRGKEIGLLEQDFKKLPWSFFCLFLQQRQVCLSCDS